MSDFQVNLEETNINVKKRFYRILLQKMVVFIKSPTHIVSAL